MRDSRSSCRGLSIAALCDRYETFSRSYYRRADGEPTTEARDIVLSFRELRAIYGDLDAESMTLSALKLVRQAMIERGLCRKLVNQRIGRVKRLFRWAAEEGLIPPDVAGRLILLSGLKIGRSRAHDHPPRRPVPREHIEPVLRHVAPPVAAMIVLQYLTGMRPGEAIVMRGADIDRPRQPWIYRPPSHKSAWRGHPKEIYLGPHSQRVLAPFLERPPEAFLFSPAESMAWWAEREPMVARLLNGHRARRARDRYRVTSYDRAIELGCQRAGVPRWTAGQLRHSAATWIERELGLEAASATLGHRLLETTQVYAHGKCALARKVAEERG